MNSFAASRGLNRLADYVNVRPIADIAPNGLA
jgi:hypothetical protein